MLFSFYPGNNISKIINDFAGEGDRLGYNWTVVNGTLDPGTNGETSARYDGVNNTVKITFDYTKFKNASDLSVARTILHEAIHAYITTKFGTGVYAANVTYADLLADNMELQDANAAHHNTMATLVSSIADALQEYGQGHSYNLNAQFYKDMAWGGLTESKDFEALPAADQIRIKNVLSIEQSGTDMNGNKTAQKGHKSGC